MDKRQSQNKEKQDVFEMILKPVENGYAFNLRQSENDWHNQPQEGQLAIDVMNTDEDIIVVSTMAGADVNKIEVHMHNDLLTIRGERPRLAEGLEDADYLYQECFWGKFSRTVVLPVDVKNDCARAEYKNGVLTIVIPKRNKDSRVSITIVED